MRKHNRKKFLLEVLHNDSLLLKRESGTLPDTMEPLSTNSKLWGETKIEKTFSLSIESHITIRPKVELSKKRISLLLEQEILRISSEGFNLIDYFGLEWMLNYLVGTSPFDLVKGKKMSTVSYCAKLILFSYRNNWNLLYKRVPIHSKILSFIEETFGFISDFKYQGRRPIYSKEKFLEVRIEDVNSIFERSQSSIRYSSYCKGYGESGHSVRKQVTKYSFDLDRDDSEVPPEEFYSFSDTIHNQEDLYLLEQEIREEKKA